MVGLMLGGAETMIHESFIWGRRRDLESPPRMKVGT